MDKKIGIYPTEFENFSGGIDIKTETINNWIKIVVGKLDAGSEHSYYRSGNTIVVGIKIDGYYEIIVSKDYSEHTISIS